jgi:hypothetical protein
MEDLNPAPFVQRLGFDERARLRFGSTRGGVLSWNTHASCGRLAFRLLRAGVPDGDWLDHSEWHGGGATSLSPTHEGTSVEIDVIAARTPFDGLEVRAAGVHFELLAFSAPLYRKSASPASGSALILDVPRRSQYAPDRDDRGWCSPTSLTMIHAFHGIDLPIENTAREVFDRAYNGTGNWSFNVAYSGRLGFRAAIAHLADFAHARRLIERNLPIAISYSWSDGELSGAPLPRSAGHIAVLCGFTANGDCAVNDPAHSNVAAVYARSELEPLWQRNGGVAYVIAPIGIEYADVLENTNA